MFILHDIFKKLKNEFPKSRKGQERSVWFIYTVIAIIVPFSSSRTSNLLRCLKTLFGFDAIREKRYYTFMASPKGSRKNNFTFSAPIHPAQWRSENTAYAGYSLAFAPC